MNICRHFFYKNQLIPYTDVCIAQLSESDCIVANIFDFQKFLFKKFSDLAVLVILKSVNCVTIGQDYSGLYFGITSIGTKCK